MSNVLLRALGPDDDPAVLALAADPDVRLWNPMKPAGDAAAWRDSVAADDDTSATFVVADPADGRMLGTASVFSIDREQGTAQVGYRVVPAERGRGVATAALSALAAYGFTERGVRRIELFHAVANPASCVVAERAGFRLEGTLRASYVYGDGTAYDEHLHARLATDAPEPPAMLDR